MKALIADLLVVLIVCAVVELCIKWHAEIHRQPPQITFHFSNPPGSTR